MFMKVFLTICMVILVSLVQVECLCISFADEIQIIATKDTTILSGPTDEDKSNESRSNGIGDYVFAGRVRGTGGNSLRRALVFFDIAGAIPSGATIMSARLTVRMSKSPDPFDRATITLHRLLGDWGEGESDADFEEGRGAPARENDATWTHRFFDDIQWSTSGGDFSQVPSAEEQFDFPEIYSWASTAEMVADVQRWLDSPETNFGWILIGEESRVGSARRIDSKDNETTDQKPTLAVEFLSPFCGITSIIPGSRLFCSADTNTYSQEITVTYNEAPDTGFLVVNNQEFPITGSPQTVTLADLPANGVTVNVTAAFSDDTDCSLTETELFAAPSSCECGIATITVSTQGLCDPDTNTYTQRLRVSYENPPETGTLDVNNQSFPVTGSPQTVILSDLIADGSDVDVTAQFSDDPECMVAATSLFTAPLACATCTITDIIADSQSACDPATNTYTQELTIQYEREPEAGMLDVNGQMFPITGSPQLVTLTNLTADSRAVDVTATFSSNIECELVVQDLFIAPAACLSCELTDIMAGNQSACDPAANTYSQEITVSYDAPSGIETLRVNGDLFQLTGSPQTVTLEGLVAGSSSPDVTAWFPQSVIRSDDFNAGTAAGWEGSGASPPTIVMDGGPAGDGDGFLLVSSLGGEDESGSRLAVFNSAQWTGDYSVLGITAVVVELNNLGDNPLDLRLLLRGNDSDFTTVASRRVVPGSGWQSHVFAIEAIDWMQLSGESTIEQALGDATQLRIFHNPEASFPGPGIVAQLGIDNIAGVCAITGRRLFTAPPICAPVVSLTPGWNLISLPLTPPDPSVKAIFSSSNDGRQPILTAPVWGWGNTRFEPTKELKALTGYWVRVDSSHSVVVPGTPPEESDSSINPGWNLIGPSVDDFPLPQNGITDDRVWGWDGVQLNAESVLRLTKGYWLYSSGTTNFITPE